MAVINILESISKTRWFRFATCVLAVSGFAYLGSGCETSSTTEDIEISPASATLSVGQSQTFTVSGGYEYTWSLDPDDGSAALSRRKGDTVVLTLLANSSDASNEVSVIEVLCASTLLDTFNPSSTNVAYSATDTAYVHIVSP